MSFCFLLKRGFQNLDSMYKMGKSREINAGGNGGIMGSGIFGLIRLGTTVRCEATDDSYFCQLSKLVNGLIMIILLIAILYLVYFVINFGFSAFGGKKMRGGSSSIFK